MRRNKLALICVLAAAIAGNPNVSRTEPSKVEINSYVAADQNKDGHLSMPEFRQLVILMAKAGNRKAKQIRFFHAYGFAFGIADRNRDGKVAPAELIKADAEN